MNESFRIGGRTLAVTALALAAGQLFAQVAPAAAASAPSAAEATEGPTGPKKLADVVVTAQKVAQPASKTPVALTVLGGEDLKEAGISDPRALTEAVPNVVISQESGKLQIAIRGVVSLDMTEKGDPSAAFNVDGAYIARFEAQTGAFLDLDRVEVLRGPQGTLYGRNATAGAINLITNKPKRFFGAHVEAEVGNYGALRAEGVVNVPLSETLALRAAVSAAKRDTYFKAGPNTDIPLESKDDYAARVHLLANFSKDTSLLLTAETSHQGGGGATPLPMGNFFTGTVVDRLPFSPANTGNNIQSPVYVDKGTDAQLTAGLRFPNKDARRDSTNQGLRGEFKTNLGFAELTYQLAHASGDLDDVQNGVYFGFPFRGGIKGTSKSTSHELRLNSVGQGHLRWVAGAYAFDEKIHRDTKYETFITAPFGSFTVLVPFNIDVHNKSQAVFGQATYALTPATRATLGLRRTQDDKSGVDTLAGTPAVAPATSSTAAYNKSASFSDTSYRLGLDHDLAPGVMAYASLATGYKAGGFNDKVTAGSYKPEHLRSLELGIKSRLMGDRLQLSAGVFNYAYQDMQLNSVVCLTADPSSCGSLTTNASNATVRGVELEARWLASDYGQWRGALSYTKAEFEQYKPNATTDWSGQQLDRAPKAVLSLGYTHRFPLASGGEISAALGQRLSSSYTISDPAAGIRYRQPMFHKTDASLGWSNDSGKLFVQLFVKNLEDKITIESRVPGAFFVGDPRTFGIRASYDF